MSICVIYSICGFQSVLSYCNLLDELAVNSLYHVDAREFDACLDGLIRLYVEGVHRDAVGIDDADGRRALQCGLDNNLMLTAVDDERARINGLMALHGLNGFISLVFREHDATGSTRTA